MSYALEDISRKDEGIFGKCLNIVLYKSLAEKLWTPFRVICYNPFYVLIVTAILYLVFCIIFVPLYLLSFVFTSYGSFLFFLYALNYLAR